MRIRAILNRDGGTLRTLDVDRIAASLTAALDASGHQATVASVAGRALAAALTEAAGEDATDCILIGGGDGSVSLAASLCWKTGKVLGILPAGTMNLFARALAIPLAIDQAISALAASTVHEADICTVNGHCFVHQVAIGMQPRMLELRRAIPYASRMGKISASLKAALRTVVAPPVFRARLKTDRHDNVLSCSMLAVSNNIYGEGHLPYADGPDQGTLGIYASPPLSLMMNLRLARDMLLGRWTRTEHVLSQTTDRVSVEILSKTKGRSMSVDGELVPLEPVLDIRLHALGLKVLCPNRTAAQSPVDHLRQALYEAGTRGSKGG